MKHFGDITKLSGYDLPVVDVITGGSPCQDLSEVYELPDSARYRLQGNGICTPFWRWMLKRISAQYERTPTLGSLFAGQGSFEYLWTSINGIGTVPWSSEIDKHGIAVITKHFGDEERGIEGDIRQFL